MVDLFSLEENIDQNGGRWLIYLGPDYMVNEQQKEGVAALTTLEWPSTIHDFVTLEYLQ